MIRYLKRGKDASAKAEADAEVRKIVDEILRNVRRLNPWKSIEQSKFHTDGSKNC